MSLIKPLRGLRLVLRVTAGESGAGEFGEVGDVGRAEERPFAAGDDALHEEVGHPVRQDEGSGTAGCLAGAATGQESRQVGVPRFEIRRAIDGADRGEHRLGKIEEGGQAAGRGLAGLVRGAVDGGPGAGERAAVDGEVGVVGDAVLHHAREAVLDVVGVVADELAARSAGVFEDRRGGQESGVGRRCRGLRRQAHRF